MKVIEKHTDVQKKYVVALYGPPKSGKSRLATCLPWGPVWGEKAIYCAWDFGAEELSSTLRPHREHLIVVTPEPSGKRYDPLTEAVAMATMDWKGKYPGVGTIIWDTMTESSRQLLHAYADTGVFSEKHITFGKPEDNSFHATPMEGDYGAAQRSTLFILDHLFKQPLNIIVIFHDNVVSPNKDKNESFNTYGGPAIAGKAGTQAVAGKFDNLFRIEADPKMDEKGRMLPKHYLYTVPKGAWLAGFRNGMKDNPLAKVALDQDPTSFWNELTKIQSNA